MENLPKVLPQTLPGLSDRELILLTLQSVSANHKSERAQIERLEKIVEKQGEQLAALNVATANLPKLQETVAKDDARLDRAGAIVWTLSIAFATVATIIGIYYHFVQLNVVQ